jgi:hypothetical protein
MPTSPGTLSGGSELVRPAEAKTFFGHWALNLRCDEWPGIKWHSIMILHIYGKSYWTSNTQPPIFSLFVLRFVLNESWSCMTARFLTLGQHSHHPESTLYQASSLNIVFPLQNHHGLPQSFPEMTTAYFVSASSSGVQELPRYRD